MFVTSPRTPTAFPPTFFTAASSSSWRRPVMNTNAPSAAKRWAVASPIPLLPPVTTAVLPSSFLLMVLISPGNRLFQPARNPQRGPRHVLGVGGSQVDRRRRDVVRLPNPPQRRRRLDILFEVACHDAHRLDPLRLDHPRVDRIDADLPRA